MKEIFKIALILLSVLPEVNLAQVGCQNDYREQYISGDIYYPYYLRYNGNPFYTDGWLFGSVKITSGEVYNHLKLEYDIYKDAIVYFNDSIKSWVLIDNEIIKEVWLTGEKADDKIVLVPNFFLDSSTNFNYYFILVKGDVSLYMKKLKLVNEYRSDYSQDKKLGEFREKTRYYFVVNHKLYQVPNSKRKLFSNFPEQADVLRKYISKNRYSLRNHNDLISIFEELNRLL